MTTQTQSHGTRGMGGFPPDGPEEEGADAEAATPALPRDGSSPATAPLPPAAALETAARALNALADAAPRHGFRRKYSWSARTERHRAMQPDRQRTGMERTHLLLKTAPGQMRDSGALPQTAARMSRFPGAPHCDALPAARAKPRRRHMTAVTARFRLSEERTYRSEVQ